MRGELAIKAEQLRDKLKKDPSSLPFDDIIGCNIGNPQQLGQKPITFFRQVLSLLEYDEMLAKENEKQVLKMYPKDALERARQIYKSCDGAPGAYSHSKGVPAVRKHVAEFIKQRDGYSADPERIFLTNGASQGVQFVLQCLAQHAGVGIMIPIPQYPLYTATLALNDSVAVPYYLNEEEDWRMDIDHLTEQLNDAREEGIDVRALCVINPGNPTGNCLPVDNLEQIVEFCHKENLALLADEVYQVNTYLPHRPFVSFKKVLQESPEPIKNSLELFSFHSVSKGVIGECGKRGGYFECVNVSDEALEQIYKLASISLCPNVQGQIMVDLMVNPPKQGDVSFELYKKETEGIYESLKRRANKLVDAFNAMENVSCNKAEGAMYLFPNVELPIRAIQEAATLNKAPDTFYALKMLEATGVVMVPGSGFGQKEGTHHFRSTFLPQEEKFDSFIEKIQNFHKDFMKKYK